MTLTERCERARLLFARVQNLVEQLQDNRNGSELWIELEEAVGQAQAAKRKDVWEEEKMIEFWDQLFDENSGVARIIILGIGLTLKREDTAREIVIRKV